MILIDVFIMKFLVLNKNINIVFVIIWGFNFYIFEWLIYYGVIYVVVELLVKLVVVGVDYKIVRFLF